jgi:hypothetical protein
MKQRVIIFWLAMAVSAQAARLPELYPPEDFIGPTFWEQYRFHSLGGAALLIACILSLWWYLRRPVVVMPVPAVVAARHSLDLLCGNAEDGILAGQVSRIVRDYLPSAIAFPQRELTAEEVALFLREDRLTDEQLRAGIVELLRDCDARKFGSVHRERALNLVSRAQDLIGKIEALKVASTVQDQTGKPDATAQAKTA